MSKIIPSAVSRELSVSNPERLKELEDEVREERRREADVASWLEGQLIKQLASAGNRNAWDIQCRVTEMREELVESGDTELETMLIQRVVLCWLVLNDAESQRQQLWTSGEVTIPKADFWDKRVSRLHNDFLKACKALAQVRKLRRPVIQVNVADKQINTTGPMSVDARDSDVQVNALVDGDDTPELSAGEDHQREDEREEDEPDQAPLRDDEASNSVTVT